MDYRKIIKFGKSSYVISIPKDWVFNNNLDKGKPVYIEQSNNNIIISSNPNDIEDQPKTKIIDVDGKDIISIYRKIISAYINNYAVIELKGNDIRYNHKEIKDFIKNLMAFEIMEQTGTKIIAKDFLRINEIKLDELIRKIDNTIRAMLEDSSSSILNENLYEEINNMDVEINKLTFLVFKISRRGLQSPKVAKMLGYNPVELVELWSLSNNLERIADETKRITKLIPFTKLSEKELQCFEKIYKQVKSNYVEMMNAYYSNKQDKADQLEDEGKLNLNQIDDFVASSREVGVLIEKLKSMQIHIRQLGRIILDRP